MFNQQIVDSQVQQEIDIDNSDVEQGDNSVNIDDSELIETIVAVETDEAVEA